MSRIGPRLLRRSVLGLVLAWAVHVVLTLTSAGTDGVAGDITWTVVLLAPTAWAYARPGPLSGAVAVVVAWPLAALTVTAMVVLPVLVIAEAMVVVAARHERG